ncbi:hypothetical protein SS50377_23425 [Spironucleus salmonicida]|uniref:Uncharacterized protein n=1 Tax=Spironucleus salmonicida TaxID=348837 RepID=V6LNC4_9EUKA|nr:hypothetical protein SS50377_23425 [Spironucleus salmonicida]|eukprot:EST46162.1 Hypothetical protein SS50377_13754 [Spironucleus salmonicida]
MEQEPSQKVHKQFKKKPYRQILEDRLHKERNAYQQLKPSEKESLIKLFQTKAKLDTQQAQQLLSTLSSHQLHQIKADEQNFNKLDYHLFQFLQKPNLALLSEELRAAIISNTNFTEQSIQSLNSLNVEFWYYLSKVNVTSLLEKFNGQQLLKIVKAVAFNVFSRENISNAEELANATTLNDADRIALCLQK